MTLDEIAARCIEMTTSMRIAVADGDADEMVNVIQRVIEETVQDSKQSGHLIGALAALCGWLAVPLTEEQYQAVVVRFRQQAQRTGSW